MGRLLRPRAPRRITAGVAVGTNPAAGVDTDLDAAGEGAVAGSGSPASSPRRSAASAGKQAAVNHNFYDHTSVLKTDRVALGPRNRSRPAMRSPTPAPTDPGNLATLLDFTHPVTKVPNCHAGHLHPDRVRTYRADRHG